MSDKIEKNCLKHEIRVKFANGILEHSQDWQWFIDYIETSYDLSDIESFTDFQSKIKYLINILSKFLNILGVCKLEFNFNKPLLEEIFLISKYYVDEFERETCNKKINTEFCKLLFVLVWLAKLRNLENNSNYITDINFMFLRNYHQSINMEAFNYDKDKIFSYLRKIKISDFEQIKKNIEDNLNKVVYAPSKNFFEKYGDKLLSANCFDYHLFDEKDNLTWQENTLLDMLKISIDDGKVLPMFSSNYATIPNYSLWTSSYLEKIKKYFKHAISDFVIESIDFLLNKNIPSLETIEKHCILLVELIKKGNDCEIYSSSTYKILALLFEKGAMTDIKKTENIKEFYKTIYSIKSIDLLLIHQQYFPISKNQKSCIKNYIENQYKSILKIEDISSFIEYLKNSNIARYINQEYYDEVKRKFLNLIKKVNDLSISILFYEKMLFLLSVNENNAIVDKRIVKQDMINIQDYWQKNIYQLQLENLQKYTYSFEISTAEIENFNKSIVNNPIILANNCIFSTNEEIIPVLKSISTNLLTRMTNKITISNIFPNYTHINFEKHEIDDMLKKQVEKIIKNNGYKLEIEKCMSTIYEVWEEKTKSNIFIFNMEKDLYMLLEKLLETRLIPYDKNISLGHLTQLFPLLEIQIRELGKLFGIVPLKENLDEFIKYKDPSSILRELIGKVYQEEIDSFKNIPDLLFVYFFMYNSNSLNIRNECIHGRNYIEGNQLIFAFKTTLLALYMIKFRINLTLNNIQNDNI